MKKKDFSVNQKIKRNFIRLKILHFEKPHIKVVAVEIYKMRSKKKSDLNCLGKDSFEKKSCEFSQLGGVGVIPKC